VRRTRGSNSQTALPGNLFLGDFDGDRQADYLQYNDGRLFLSRIDVLKSAISHVMFHGTADRVFTGDFYGAGWDQACVLTNALIRCYGIDPAVGPEFAFWFQQTVDISVNEDVIVGDYDGDGRDEMLLYDNTAGAFRMLEVAGDAYFSAKTDYDPANLASMMGRPGLRFRAGDYDGDGKTDIFGIDEGRHIYVFHSVLNGGMIRSWFAFSTVRGFVHSDEDLMLARVNDDLRDDFVLHRAGSGAINFFRVQYNGGIPPAITIPVPSILVQPNSVMAMSFSHPSRNEPGADTRDDIFVENTNPYIYKGDSRWDTTAQNYTYEFALSHEAPDNSFGWPARQEKSLLFVKCRYSGTTDEPHDNAFYQALAKRFVDYYGENTYGGLDLTSSQVMDDWADMGITLAQVSAQPSSKRRGFVTSACANAWGGSFSSYAAVVMLENANYGAGNQGKYALLGPNYQDVWVGIQETSHALGWHPHSGNDLGQEYGDAWDVMSGQAYGYWYTNPLGVPEGPGMNAFNRNYLGFFADQRVLVLPPGTATTSYFLTALNRPEGGAALEIRLQTTPGTSSYDYYSVEYREPSGYDQAIPRNTVLVHGVNSKGWLITADPTTTDYEDGSERLPGETLVTAEGITIHVVSIDAPSHRALVEVSN
jgi:hypothetical protein